MFLHCKKEFKVRYQSTVKRFWHGHRGRFCTDGKFKKILFFCDFFFKEENNVPVWNNYVKKSGDLIGHKSQEIFSYLDMCNRTRKNKY